MKITTKENANGKINGYFVDGQKVRKCEVESLACNTDAVVEIDYYTAKQFPLIEKPRKEMKVVFTGYYGGQILMTEAAANELGATIGRSHSVNVYYVDMDTVKIDNAPATDEEKADEITTVEVETPATVEVEIGGKVQEFHHIDADTITNKNGSCTLKIYNTEYHNIPHSYELHSQICGLSDEVIIDMEIKTYGHDSANLLCKFIATTTDGSEDDADDNDEFFYLLPNIDELNDVEIEEPAQADEVNAENHISEQFKAARKFADKLIRVDRLSEEQADAVIAATFDGNHDAEAVKKIIDDFKTANFNEAQKVATRLEEITSAEIAAADAADLNENLDAQKQTLIDEAETLDAKIQALEVNFNHEFDKYEVADEKFARAWFEPASVKAALKAARDEQHAVVGKILAELTPLRERKKELTATIADLICRQMDNTPTPNDEPQGWIVPVEMPARKFSDIEIADLLTDRLYKVTNKGILGGNYMDVTLQNGKKTAGNVRTAIVEPNWHGNGNGFVFITPWNEVYARYDTAEQVNRVINLIEATVKRGDTEFTYPANEPPKLVNARAVDFDIYHADSNLTGDELADYTSKLREALTANGNKGTVTCEDNFIAVIGNDGGDNKRLAELLKEMCERGCEVEVVDDEAAERSEMTGWEFDALAALGTNVPAESVDIPAPVTIEVPTPENAAVIDDDAPAKFEAGKTYHCYDWINDCAGKDTFTITKRTAKTVVVDDLQRCKIRTDSQGEYIEPYKGYFIVTVRAKHCADVPVEVNEPAVAVETPALTIEVPTPEFITEPVKEFAFNVARFNDDFIAQRDELKANVRIAHDALVVAQDNFDDAENALRKFFNKAAYALCEDFQQAQATLGDKKIIIERQCGLRLTIYAESDVYIDIHGGETFAFVDGNNKTLARYDTPAQVKAVIGKFAAAIKNGNKLFTFPTAEELNA